MKRSIEQRAEARARRINRKREAQEPLLARAGLVQKTTPAAEEEFLRRYDAAYEQWKEEFRQHEHEMECRASLIRFVVRGIVGAEELKRLDERRKTLPATSEYSADFWSRQYRRLTAEVITFKPEDWKGPGVVK